MYILDMKEITGDMYAQLVTIGGGKPIHVTDLKNAFSQIGALEEGEGLVDIYHAIDALKIQHEIAFEMREIMSESGYVFKA